jgi:GDSL-like Lipase/Acylhydrolase family
MPEGPSNSELRIAGFGACMISGYPHAAGGMLEVACSLIEQRLSRPVRSKIVTLGGFPAPRAEKHLKSKVLDFNPDYVVIQFASTDAQCPIRRRNHPTSKAIAHSSAKHAQTFSYHHRQATMLSPLRWELASLIAQLRNFEPITPIDLYIPAIERMAKYCGAASAKPIVLSPFVYGSRCTMKNAITYTTALRELAEAQDMILVDCLVPLTHLPKRSILQHDGFHLSQAGHKAVGEAIAHAVLADVLK